MDTEERHKLYDNFHSGVKMMVEKISRIAQDKDKFSMAELGCLADIMKDLAMTEKGLAKATHYYKENSEEIY